MGKFPDSDAAVQIAEEAFRAGWKACADARDAIGPHARNVPSTPWDAWSEFQPSEAVKDLVR